MTGTIEITVKVYLAADVDADHDDDQIAEIVTAVVEGETHPLIDNVELVKFTTE